MIWKSRPIDVFFNIPTIRIVHLSFDPMLVDKVGSPPAHRHYLLAFLCEGRTALHRLQKLIQHFQIFILGLKLLVLFQCR
jgi:hypothetical protein